MTHDDAVALYLLLVFFVAVIFGAHLLHRSPKDCANAAISDDPPEWWEKEVRAAKLRRMGIPDEP
jgi:hypothetical protein